MFENVLPEYATEVIDDLLPVMNDFYLAGGTGLALQEDGNRGGKERMSFPRKRESREGEY
jgi:hypothetical protein